MERTMTETIGKWVWRNRVEADLSQSELGDKIDVTNATVSNWENGKTTPSYDKMQLLEKVFGESFDEHGLQGDEEREGTMTETIGEWVWRNRGEADLSQSELGDKIDVTSATVSNWENGKTTPSYDKMQLLEKMFGESFAEHGLQGDEEREEGLDPADHEQWKQLKEEVGSDIRCIGTFDPKNEKNIPDCAGIYILYSGNNNQLKRKPKKIKFTGNPVYIGEGGGTGGIRKRIKDHGQKWWWPGLDVGVFIEIDGRKEKLRRDLEKILIKLMSPERNRQNN